MLIDCPECGGKLSSAAPSCPHCGFVQAIRPVEPAKAPAPNPNDESTSIALVPVSVDALRVSARKRWTEWRLFNSRRFLIGGITLILALLLITIAVHLASRLNH